MIDVSDQPGAVAAVALERGAAALALRVADSVATRLVRTSAL